MSNYLAEKVMDFFVTSLYFYLLLSYFCNSLYDIPTVRLVVYVFNYKSYICMVFIEKKINIGEMINCIVDVNIKTIFCVIIDISIKTKSRIITEFKRKKN